MLTGYRSMVNSTVHVSMLRSMSLLPSGHVTVRIFVSSDKAATNHSAGGRAAGPAFGVSRKNPGKGKRVCNTDETGLREETGTGPHGWAPVPVFFNFSPDRPVYFF